MLAVHYSHYCIPRTLPYSHLSSGVLGFEEHQKMSQNNSHHNSNTTPHLATPQTDSPSVSPAIMSNPQQQSQPPRPQFTDANNAYVSSPSLPPNQNYYLPQHTEQYRASPTGSNGAMSLPSMRALDSMQQQSQSQSQQPAPLPQQAQMHHMGSPLPPAGAPMNQPYYHNAGQILPPPPHQYPGVSADPNAMRYVLPIQHDNRIMSGGRHKKVRPRRDNPVNPET